MGIGRQAHLPEHMEGIVVFIVLAKLSRATILMAGGHEVSRGPRAALHPHGHLADQHNGYVEMLLTCWGIMAQDLRLSRHNRPLRSLGAECGS